MNNNSVINVWSNQNNFKNAALSVEKQIQPSFPQQYQPNRPLSHSYDGREFIKKPFYSNQPMQDRKIPYKANEPQAHKQPFNKYDAAKSHQTVNYQNESLNKNSNFNAASAKNQMSNRNSNPALLNKEGANNVGNSFPNKHVSNGFYQEPALQKPQTQSVWELRKQIYSQKLAQEEYEREMQMIDVNIPPQGASTAYKGNANALNINANQNIQNKSHSQDKIRDEMLNKENNSFLGFNQTSDIDNINNNNLSTKSIFGQGNRQANSTKNAPGNQIQNQTSSNTTSNKPISNIINQTNKLNNNKYKNANLDFQSEDTYSYNDYYNDPNYVPEEDEMSEEVYGDQIPNRSLRAKGKEEQSKKPLKITVQGGKVHYEQSGNSMIEKNSAKNLNNKINNGEKINANYQQEEIPKGRNLKKKQINKNQSIMGEPVNQSTGFPAENNNKGIKGKKLMKVKQTEQTQSQLNANLNNQSNNIETEKPIKLKFDMNKLNMKAKLLEDQLKTSTPNINRTSQNTSELDSPPIRKLANRQLDNKTLSNNLINLNSNANSKLNDLNASSAILNNQQQNLIASASLKSEKGAKNLPEFSTQINSTTKNNQASNSLQSNNNNSFNSRQVLSAKSMQVAALYAQKALLTEKCHQAEIADREDRKNINVFEIDPLLSFFDSSKRKFHLKIKPEYAIKAFKRSAADVKMDNPEFLRPPSVLFSTVKYLCDNILDIDDPQKQFQSNLSLKYFQYPGEPYSFKDICLFAEDRFRAIRQDFIILAPKASLECIQSHEIIARFLILSLNQCLDFKAFSGSQSLFKLQIQQLNATLTSLREFYSFVDRNVSEQRVALILNANKAEFIAYSVMLSITDNFDLVSMLNLVTPDIRGSPLIKLAEQVVRKVLSRDYIGFFKILKTRKKIEDHFNFDYLSTCIMSLYLKDMRRSALDVISAKVERRVFNYSASIKFALDLLAFENFKEFFDFLNWYGIKFPAEIREYLRYLRKTEASEEGNDMRDDLSETSSLKLSNSGSEGNNEIKNSNAGFSYFNSNKNSKYNNNGVLNSNGTVSGCNLDEQTFEEIKDLFENYNNKEYFYGEGKGAKSRFAYMEFFAETAIKDESDLFRVTNKRYIEAKRDNRTRKEILIENISLYSNENLAKEIPAMEEEDKYIKSFDAQREREEKPSPPLLSQEQKIDADNKIKIQFNNENFERLKSKSKIEIEERPRPDNSLNGNQSNCNNNNKKFMNVEDKKSLFLKKTKLLKLINNRIISELD